MVAVFLIVLGIVGGFFLCMVAREWLRACEARQKAMIARREALEAREQDEAKPQELLTDSLTAEERRDLEAEKRGDFRHCDPDVDYEELDRVRDQEEAERQKN